MMYLQDFLEIMYGFNALQFDQLRSVSEGDTDPDSYNFDHLRTIKRTLEQNNGYGGANFDEDIEFIETLLDGEE